MVGRKRGPMSVTPAEVSDKKIHDGAVAVIATAGSGLTFSGDGISRFHESPNGLKEATAVVSTTGTGTFVATINQDETEICPSGFLPMVCGSIRSDSLETVRCPATAAGRNTTSSRT